MLRHRQMWSRATALLDISNEVKISKRRYDREKSVKEGETHISKMSHPKLHVGALGLVERKISTIES